MSDIIDTIDNLARDERDLRCEPNSARWFKTDQLLCTELKKHWPAISARLREAERKAKAFDVIEQAWLENRFDITIGGRRDDEFIDIDASGYNLLTAIEAAIAAKETEQ